MPTAMNRGRPTSLNVLLLVTVLVLLLVTVLVLLLGVVQDLLLPERDLLREPPQVGLPAAQRAEREPHPFACKEENDARGDEGHDEGEEPQGEQDRHPFGDEQLWRVSAYLHRLPRQAPVTEDTRKPEDMPGKPAARVVTGGGLPK